MRFFKLFLISFGSLIGIVGGALGIMFLAGSFTEPSVYPEQIEFTQSKFEVSNDFEMTLTSSTEAVTETKVTLSFGGAFSEDNGKITDGVITLPKYVTIGTPFQVTLNKESKLMGDERLAWIKGGISTVKATSTNVNARIPQVKVYVDVPVYSLHVQTMTTLEQSAQSSFNINSTFWAKANFLPEESMYQYGKNGSDGNAAEYKSVFFSSLSGALEETDQSTHHAQQYRILEPAKGVAITAQAFSSIQTERQALELVSGLEPELAKSQLLAILDSMNADQKAQENVSVDFEELVVGQYSINNSSVPSKFNSAIQIFANKQTSAENTYNLNLQILATDGVTSLQSEIKRVGIALAVQGANGLEPALDSQFQVFGQDYTTATFNGKQYKFYFPLLHQVDINQSYWEMVALAENLSAKIIVVLFDETPSGYVVNNSSLQNGNLKYALTVDQTEVSSDQIYWASPSITNTILYVYDNIDVSQVVYQQYDLKNLSYVIPNSNSYKSVVYFAYLEEEGGVVSSELVSNYITVGSKTVNYQFGSSQNVTLYEIPNGVITPKGSIDFPEGFVIKVVFATVKTNYNGSYIFDGNRYIVDKFSSSSQLGTLQTLSFEIAKTLKTIDSHLEFLHTEAAKSQETLAVVAGSAGAFDVVFDVTEEQKSIFVRDYNQGRINLVFKINNVVSNLFSFNTVVFDESMSTFSIPVKVDFLTYQTNDPGYRNFTVQVSYQRGYENPVFIGVNSATYHGEEESETLDNPTFEVYDGKIARLTFESDLSAVTSSSPITVKTSLEKDLTSGHSKTGVSYAAQGSTNSFIRNGLPFDKNLLYVPDTDKISIKAFDKYEREITNESLWTLVSDDATGKILSVDATGQTLNYLGTSVNPIRVYISSINGVGGRVVTSPYSIYFHVQTLGKIVYVAKNTTEEIGNDEVIYTNYNENSYDIADNTFAINSEESVFDASVISAKIVGRQGKTVNLTNLSGQNNLITMFYALPAETAGRYNIFDLLKITKFVREDSSSFDEFIEFNYTDDNDTYIESFTITKNFGQTAYLNLKLMTDIGISYSVRIEIAPNLNVVVGEYGHQSEGAQGGLQYSIRYTGVYANYEIEVKFTFSTVEPFALDIGAFKPLLYNFDTKEVVALAGKTGMGTVSVEQNVVTVKFTIPDVAGAAYQHYVFVLDSRAAISETNYSKTLYDYSRDLYLRVNPNIAAELNRYNPEVSAMGTSANIKVASLDIMSVVTVDPNNTTSLIYASRVIGTKALTLTGSNHVIAKITNQLSIPVSSQYFSLNESQQIDNILRLRYAFSISQTIYITVFHYINASQYYIVGMFTITITPDIATSEDYAENFVVYSGTKYLQLEGNKEYDFTALATYFDVSKDVNFNLQVSFDSSYATQKTYWDISANKIYIKPTTVILANRLQLTVLLIGVDQNNNPINIATANFPVLIMPRKAPLVLYDTTPNDITADDELNGLTHMQRNAEANSDLANLLSVNYLVENDIYDIVPDGLTFADGFKVLSKSEQPYGLYPDDMVLYSIRNGNGGFEGTEVAAILSDGTLSTNFVGQDTYIIVVATINGLNVYYRLKIISSLALHVYYPYGDNDSQEEIDKAEYILFKPTDTLKVVTINETLALSTPASATQIQDVYEVDLNAENGFKEKETYITNRLMMFRYVSHPNENAKVAIPFAIESVSIQKIELGLMTDEIRTAISASNFSNYVVVTFDELTGKRNVTLKNVTSYVTVLQIKTTTGAVAQYTFAVEQSSRTYSVVEKTAEGQYISQMTPIAENYALNIKSPELGKEATTLDVLNNMKLKATLSSSSQDRTDMLRFHIFNDKDLISIENKMIHAEFSVESVFASLMFYTKYGPLKTVPLTLESLIKVVAIDYDPLNISQKFSDVVYSGSVYNLGDNIRFIEVGDTITNISDVKWQNISFASGTPNYIELLIDNRSFVIMPFNQGVEKTVVLNVTVLIHEEEFHFDFTLTIKSPVVANNPNSLQLTPLEMNVYGGEDVQLDIFGSEGFFVWNGQELLFSSTSNVITGTLHEGYQYTLNILPISGASAIQSTRSINENGKLVLRANAVSFDTEVVLQATLTLSKGSGTNLYEFSNTSYLSFVVKPDAVIEKYYPAPSGNQLTFESIYYGNGLINLSKNASFQTENRIVVISQGGNRDKDIYVTYRISAGEPTKFIVNKNGTPVTNGQNPYKLDDDFTFAFDSSSTFSFATVDFEIFVSGISREIYTVRVYKDMNSVYGIKINTINTVEGASEVFFLGEDRSDIFNGVQAFQYTVSTSLASAAQVALYHGTQPLGITLDLLVAEKGVSKTLKVTEYSSVLDNLTLNSIRFRINNGSTYLTYSQIGSYFQINQNGMPSFNIVRRAVITYLGFEIYDNEFLSDITITDSSQEGAPMMSEYKISFASLGAQVTEKNNNMVSFSISSGQSQSSNLGTYAYNVKVNLLVTWDKNTAIEITAGEKLSKMLSVLGVKKVDGSSFVTYQGETVYVDNKVENGNIKFVPSLKTENGVVSLVYADTLLPYSHLSAVQPIQYSVNRLYNSTTSEYYTYDFELLATGAPNASIIGYIIFNYTYKDTYTNKSYSFTQEYKVKINPNWNFVLLNGSGGENTQSTPEVITKDYFGTSNNYVDVLVDAQNPILTKIYALKTNNPDAGNLALGLTYKIISPVNYSGIASVVYTYQSGLPTVVGIRLYKPEFAIRNIQVEISDAYLYKVVYFYKVEPAELISYGGISDIHAIYEGDSFMIEYAGMEGETSVDHLITLSTYPSSTSFVQFVLKTSDGVVIDAIDPSSTTNIASTFNFKYIDQKWFSENTRTVSVYLEMHLKQLANGEPYVIRTETFFLYQRYGTVIGNVNVRDGYETNLLNHIQIKDFKVNTFIGVPELLNEKTLVLSNANMFGKITVHAIDQGYNVMAKDVTIENNASATYKYFMLSELFGSSITNLNNYTFVISRIEDDFLGIHLSIESDNLIITGNEELDTYVVHLFDGVKYLDVTITTDSIQLSVSNWTIVGYEKLSESLAILVETEVIEENTVHYLSFSNKPTELSITLKNIGQISSGIDTILVEQTSENQLRITYKNGKLVHSTEYFDMSTVTGAFNLDFNGAYVGGESNWIITSLQYENNAGESPFTWNIRKDKKLVITTIEKQDAFGQAEKIKIYLNGENEFIEVALNKDGRQAISLMEYKQWGGYANYNASNFALSSTNPILTNDVLKVKDMTYYSDTLELTFGYSDRTANVSFRLTRERNGVETYYDFGVTLKAYVFSYALGISKAFGDMIAVNDIYTLKVTSLQSVEPNSITVQWPNMTKEQAITATTNYTTADFGSYVVDSMESIEIANGLQTFNIESALRYQNESSNSMVIIPRYYIIQFRNACHVLNVTNFKVSPYYYSMANVYTSESQRIVTDYAQIVENGQTRYKVAFETWAKGITFKDSLGNAIPLDTLIGASTQYNRIKFSITEQGGSGLAYLDSSNNLYTEFDIQLGLTYFTINVYVSLNGATADENTQWLYIGDIVLTLDSNPQYFLSPKDNQGNAIGYTLALDKFNEDTDVFEETMVRYFEIQGNDTIVFSTNSLFASENINSYGFSRTTISDLTSVNLTPKEEAYYQVSNLISNNTYLNTVLKSEKIFANGYPFISAINIVNGESITLELEKDGTLFSAVYVNNTGATIFGSVNITDFEIQNSAYTIATLPGGIETYNIRSSSNKVNVAFTKLDLSQIRTISGSYFFGDGTSEGAPISSVIAGIDTSMVFKLKKLLTPVTSNPTAPITSVEVTVAASSVDYYAITQVVTSTDVGREIVAYAQTYVYRASNMEEGQNDGINHDIPRTMALELMNWNSDAMPEFTEEYTSVVLVEKLAGYTSFTGPSLIALSGNYMFSLGTYYGTTYEESLAIVKYQTTNGVQKNLLTNETVVEFYDKSAFDASSLPAIYTKRLQTNDLQVPAENKVLNIIHKTTGIDKPNYVYEYHETDTIVPLSQTEILIILKSDNGFGKLIWHELKDEFLPLDLIYYSIFEGGEWVAMTPDAEISNLEDKTVVGNLWNGVLEVETLYSDDTYLQIAYEDEVIYFQFGAYRNNANKVLVGELFKSSLNEYFPVDVTLLGQITEYSSGLNGFVSNAGFYSVSYNGHVYAVLNYPNASNYNLFDLVYEEEDGQNTFTHLKQSLLEFVLTDYTGLRWAVEESGYYAFEYNGNFVVEHFETILDYNLFNLFNTDLLLSFYGDVTITKLSSSLIADESDIQETPYLVYVRVEDAQNPSNYKNYSTIYEFDAESNQWMVIINLDEQFIMNLQSIYVNFYQLESSDGAELTSGNFFARQNNFSLVELFTTGENEGEPKITAFRFN